MKIKVSGSMGMKIMLEPYSPGEVSSYVEIEDEVSDKLFTEDEMAALQEKVNQLLKADVVNKMKIVAKQYSENKKGLKAILNNGGDL